MLNKIESKIMLDFDEDKYLNKFCEKIKCNECDGSDYCGEPNGYGCTQSESYVSKWYQSILKRRLKKLQGRNKNANR